MSSKSKTVRIKLSKDMASTIVKNEELIGILIRQSAIILEFAEGLFNLGKLDFSYIRIQDGYYDISLDDCESITVTLNKSKHSTIFSQHSELPYRERGIALSCMLLKATEMYLASDSDMKLKVLRCTGLIEDIQIQGLEFNTQDQPVTKALEVTPNVESKADFKVQAEVIENDFQKTNDQDDLLELVKKNDNIFDDFEDDFESHIDDSQGYTQPAEY